tara:strand:+ start:12995 stop:13456 length:462 start_codon:yes stop_codon:yes gene_type:complete
MEEYKKVIDNIKKKINSDTNFSNNDFIEQLKVIQKNILQSLDINVTSILINNKEDIFINLDKMAILTLNYLATSTDISKIQIINNNKDLFERKNNDYGSSYKDFTLLGLIVRINDKINRFLNIQNKNTMVDEDKYETINDLYNYCIISLIYSY